MRIEWEIFLGLLFGVVSDEKQGVLIFLGFLCIEVSWA
jgi:hypothetical protein